MNDGCFYDVVIDPDLHYYFMDVKKAEEFLWEYYTECPQWEKDSEEVREYNKYTLSTIGSIGNVGSIFEEYFEDFE